MIYEDKNESKQQQSKQLSLSIYIYIYTYTYFPAIETFLLRWLNPRIVLDDQNDRSDHKFIKLRAYMYHKI